MKAVLVKRVERLEEKMNPQPKLWITISKLDVPDQETGYKMGKLNIEAVKLMRSARVAGISFHKVVKRGNVCPDDFCEGGSGMLYEDWIVLLEYYRQAKTSSGRQFQHLSTHPVLFPAKMRHS